MCIYIYTPISSSMMIFQFLNSDPVFLGGWARDSNYCLILERNLGRLEAMGLVTYCQFLISKV